MSCLNSPQSPRIHCKVLQKLQTGILWSHKSSSSQSPIRACFQSFFALAAVATPPSYKLQSTICLKRNGIQAAKHAGSDGQQSSQPLPMGQEWGSLESNWSSSIIFPDTFSLKIAIGSSYPHFWSNPVVIAPSTLARDGSRSGPC